MFFVYIITSVTYPNQTYIGFTLNVEKRLHSHNRGGSLHTAKYKPWNLVAYFGFNTKEVAQQFEKYLKTQSGRAFAKKRFMS